jgi:hypothetical protein
MVLVYDLLFGIGAGATGPYKQQLIQSKTRLQAELARLKIRRKVKTNEELIPEHIRNASMLQSPCLMGKELVAHHMFKSLYPDTSVLIQS